MTDSDLIAAVKAKPEIANLMRPVENGGFGWQESKLTTHLSSFIPGVVSEVSMAHGWDFSLSETTSTTVADQGVYTLGGANKDAAGIYNIRIGTTLLRRITPNAMDEIQSRRTVTLVSYWQPAGRAGTLPKVELVAAPSDSGDTIDYRYWRNNVSLDQFPTGLYHLLEVALAKRLIASYEGLYDKVLSEAVSAYRGPQTGADTSGLDSEILRRNNERNNMHSRF